MRVPAETPDSKHLRRGANKQPAIGQAIITYPGPRVKRASFRVKAAPPPGKKGSCNHSTNISLDHHLWPLCSPVFSWTEPFTLEVPRGSPGSGKQKQLLMFGLQAFLYFSCLPYSPCSPFFQPSLQPR